MERQLPDGSVFGYPAQECLHVSVGDAVKVFLDDHFFDVRIVSDALPVLLPFPADGEEIPGAAGLGGIHSAPADDRQLGQAGVVAHDLTPDFPTLWVIVVILVHVGRAMFSAALIRSFPLDLSASLFYEADGC